MVGCGLRVASCGAEPSRGTSDGASGGWRRARRGPPERRRWGRGERRRVLGAAPCRRELRGGGAGRGGAAWGKEAGCGGQLGSSRRRRRGRVGWPGRPCAPASVRPARCVPEPSSVRRENGFGRFGGGGRSPCPCPCFGGRGRSLSPEQGLGGTGSRWGCVGGAGRLVPLPWEGTRPRSAQPRCLGGIAAAAGPGRAGPRRGL